MRGGVLLKFGGPTADEIALDAFQRVDGIAEVPFFVLLGDVGVSRRRFAGDFVLELVQVVLEEVVVDRFHGEKALVADRTDEDLLPVGVRWTRRRGVLGVIVVVALVLIVVRTVALLFGAAVTVAMEFLRRQRLAGRWRGLFRGFDG